MRRDFGTLSCACRIKQLNDLGSLQSLRPGAWSGPRFRVRFDGVSAAREKQFHDLNASPPACPPERSTFEQVVAHIETRSGIEQNDGKLKTRTAVVCNNLMEYGLAMLGIAVMRSSAD